MLAFLKFEASKPEDATPFSKKKHLKNIGVGEFHVFPFLILLLVCKFMLTLQTGEIKWLFPKRIACQNILRI